MIRSEILTAPVAFRLVSTLQSKRYGFVVALLLLLLNSVGCSPDAPDTQASETATNLMVLYRAYVEFSNDNQAPPKSQSDLEPYIESERFASTFLSPRDGKPYVVYWGTPVVMSRHENATVIAHEQNGVGNKRYLITAHGISEMSDEQFEAAGLPKN